MEGQSKMETQAKAFEDALALFDKEWKSDIVYNDVCAYNLRVTPLFRSNFEKKMEEINLPPPTLNYKNFDDFFPHIATECYCMDTTCGINFFSFEKSLSLYIKEEKLQIVSNIVACLRDRFENDDKNMIKTHPMAIAQRLRVIDKKKEDPFIKEENKIEWRRVQSSGPINIPEEFLENARAFLYKNALQVLSINPNHTYAKEEIEMWAKYF